MAAPAKLDQPVTRRWRPPIRCAITQVSSFPTFNQPQSVHVSEVIPILTWQSSTSYMFLVYWSRRKRGLAQTAGLAMASPLGPPNQMRACTRGRVFLHSHGAAGSARRQSSAVHRFASSTEQWSHRFRSRAEQAFETFTAHWFWYQKELVCRISTASCSGAQFGMMSHVDRSASWEGSTQRIRGVSHMVPACASRGLFGMAVEKVSRSSIGTTSSCQSIPGGAGPEHNRSRCGRFGSRCYKARQTFE